MGDGTLVQQLPTSDVAATEPAGVSIPSQEMELNQFVNQVRLFTRDEPELNRLIRGYESSNRQIVWAMCDALDDFNTTPPFTNFGLRGFPSKSLLLRGTVISLLESVGLFQTRNQLQFSDGGIQVGINDKTPYIQSWLQLLKNSYEERKLRIKIAMNIEAAWGGGIFSEYAFVNSFYGEWS
jgi:hypothetical protein